MGRPSEEAIRRAFACLREGTEILRTGGGTILTAAQCNLILDAFEAQGRVIEAARRYVATRKTPGYSAVQAAAAFNALAALAAGGETETPAAKEVCDGCGKPSRTLYEVEGYTGTSLWCPACFDGESPPKGNE